MEPKIAIVGKTNTGKSTLFNRIIGFRKAIVLKEEGITRDRNFADFTWKDRKFILIDTGGIDFDKKKGSIQNKIVNQTKKAIAEADLVIFLLDFMTGIQSEDVAILKFMRRYKKKIILVINKMDINKKNYFLGDFYQLGLGDPLLISAEQGANVDRLLDEILKIKIDEKTILSTEKEENIINVAIIGKPNVGKSSLLNALINDDRIIIDDKPGTTRDAIEVVIQYQEYRLRFIDTAGLRRRKKVNEKVEYFGNKRSLNSIKEADLVLFVLDSTHLVSMQDKRLADRINREGKACIIILNKYDLLRDQIQLDASYLQKMIRYELRFLKNRPLLTTISVGKRKNINTISKMIIEVYQEYNKKISTPSLNQFLQQTIQKKIPKIMNNRRLNLYYITQIGIKPPSFKVFVNDTKLLYNAYQRYLENQLINYYGFKGTPIILNYQNRKTMKR